MDTTSPRKIKMIIGTTKGNGVTNDAVILALTTDDRIFLFSPAQATWVELPNLLDFIVETDEQPLSP